MATVLKPNRAEVASVPSFESDITVEDYLTQEFEKIVEVLSVFK